MNEEGPGSAASGRLRHPLGVQCGLFLGCGERPGGARAALGAKDEVQLLGGAEAGGVGTERRTWLWQVQGTEMVAPEIAFVARHFAGMRSTPATLLLRQDHSPSSLSVAV
jgi:hypothetical protein